MLVIRITKRDILFIGFELKTSPPNGSHQPTGRTYFDQERLDLVRCYTCPRLYAACPKISQLVIHQFRPYPRLVSRIQPSPTLFLFPTLTWICTVCICQMGSDCIRPQNSCVSMLKDLSTVRLCNFFFNVLLIQQSKNSTTQICKSFRHRESCLL